METPEAKTILITDDNYDILLVTSMRLKEKGYKVLTAIDGVEALKIVETEAVDLVILDISMPNMDGMEVCRRIKANKNIPYIPIVFFTAKDSVEEKVKGMKMGVADYITKPVDHRELIARVEMVLENSAIQEKISYKDEITGLSNYNFFKKQLNYHYEISKRYGRIFSLLVLDVDKFKSINDTQGHLCGNI
ncbi:MAG TPA: response regulator, partial [Candidatus Omnitrophota bacterium]|nr:response regulator [Candidatus Omnitrophota bacterium]